MDKIPDNILNTIKALIRELESNHISIEQSVLYGSYAKGTNNQYSDIDLALVSKDFSGNRFMDKDKIRKYIVAINTDISPMPFRPEDFTEDDFFVNEILKHGIRIT
ncbi:MAG: nucleotidyltransferase domain-containing protein [bacterium]